MSSALSLEARRQAFLNALRLKTSDMIAGSLREGDVEKLIAAVAAAEGRVDENFATIEASTERMRKAGALIPRIACRKGCGTCCHIRVTLSVPELLRISHHLRQTRSPEELAVLIERCQTYREALVGLTPSERSIQRIPCVFLGEDETCEIHSVRGISCRRHHSMDLQACLRAHAEPDRLGVPQNLEYSTVTQPIVDGLDQETLRARRAVRRVDLVSALLLCLQTDAESRWLAGEDSFAEAEDTEFLKLAQESSRSGQGR